MRIKRTAVVIAVTVIVTSVILLVVFTYHPDPKRPQEPSKPYPYYTEDVAFQNNQSEDTLAGTLTLPSAEGKYPAVILISGSGGQNRDEEIAGHKPFLVIADHLTRNGIAVLRYDDRGIGKSTGDFKAATTVDFAADAASAVRYLKTRIEIDTSNIGLIGHSEGGIVAPMVASSTEDVRFIVMLAAPGIQVMQVLMRQQELIPRMMGLPESDVQKNLTINEKAFKMILSSNDQLTLKNDLAKLIADRYDDIPAALLPPNMTKAQVVSIQSEILSSHWYKNLLSYDPAPTLEKVACPVLALNGEKDIQVTPHENLTGISDALTRGGNTNFTVKELPDLNHLFQECETGSLTEYGTIEQTFSPVALNEISNWILKQVR